MSFLRYSAFVAAVYLFAFSVGFAQPEKIISVGKQPVKIIPHNERVHVFCAQTDVNFNAIQETGDAPAAWYIVDAQSGTILSVKQFAWNGTDYVSSAALDAQNNFMYCNDKNYVRKFDALNQQELDSLYAKTAAGISLNQSGNLMALSLRPNFQDPGKIILYNLENGDTTVQLKAGVNVRQSVFYDLDNNNRGLVVLNEGLFGSNSSWLHIWTLTSEKTTMDSILLGNTGNHVFVDGDYAYATVNGSHNIVIVDLFLKKIVDTISTGTSGFDGPRETIKIGKELFVTTFEGDVRRISLETKKITEKFISHGKPEGLAKVGEKIWIADAYQQGQFSVDSTVSVWNYTVPIASLSETIITQTLSIAPHPVQYHCTVFLPQPFPLNSLITVTLLSMTGEEIPYTHFYYDSAQNAITMPTIQNVNAGIYRLRISDGIHMFNGSLIIVK